MATDATALSGTFAADPIHSSLAFSIPAMGVSTFRSGFERVTATLDAEGEAPRLTAAVELESLALREPAQFRSHLLSGELFAAEQFPQATFESEAVDLKEDGTVTLTGLLSFRGQTGRVAATGLWSAPVADASGNLRAHLSLTGTINRREYGIEFQQPLPNGDDGLGGEVTVSVELALIARG